MAFQKFQISWESLKLRYGHAIECGTQWGWDFLLFMMLSRLEIQQPTSRGHFSLNIAPIDAILGSTDIYSKRAFHWWVDCSDLTLCLKVMAVTSMLPWEKWERTLSLCKKFPSFFGILSPRFFGLFKLSQFLSNFHLKVVPDIWMAPSQNKRIIQQ